ncbi:MAG: NAD(P)-dependent oxidoreductase [Dehalococcoidia bacterium]
MSEILKKVVLTDLEGFPEVEGKPLAGVDLHSYYDIPNDETFIQRCNGASIIAWAWFHLTREVIDRCSALEMVCYLGVGAGSRIDLQYAKSRGIMICNTPHYGDLAVAEHAITLTMASARKLVQADRAMRQGKWEYFVGMELRGATMGIVGLGSVGAVLAAIGNGLGMNVISHTKHPSPGRARENRVRFVGLDELMSTSDFVQLALALNDETRRIIGERELGLMRKDAYLINVARSGLIDADALLRVLKEGRIAGYATDVFEEEPVKKDPLLELDNVISSPHIAFDTPGAKRKMLEIGIDNVKAYLQGRPQNIYEA